MIHFQPKVKPVYFALLATLAIGGLGLRIGMQALDVYLKRTRFHYALTLAQFRRCWVTGNVLAKINKWMRLWWSRSVLRST